MEKNGCGDQLLTSGDRVAIVCLATGEIVIDDLRGNRAAIDGTLPALAAAAMSADGTIYVATADRQLAAVAAGTTGLVRLDWPREWSGTVTPDGLAVVPGATTAGLSSTVIAQRADDGSWLRTFSTVYSSNTVTLIQRTSLRLAAPPEGGVLALWPFAYYTVGKSIRHVDLNTGLLETMVDVGTGAAVPLVVVNR
jgi:hypothetical protein